MYTSIYLDIFLKFLSYFTNTTIMNIGFDLSIEIILVFQFWIEIEMQKTKRKKNNNRFIKLFFSRENKIPVNYPELLSS